MVRSWAQGEFDGARAAGIKRAGIGAEPDRAGRAKTGIVGPHILRVGEKRKMKLLRYFGSIERIAKASADELSPFVGKKTAAEIFAHFENQRRLGTGSLVPGETPSEVV